MYSLSLILNEEGVHGLIPIIILAVVIDLFRLILGIFIPA